MSWIAEHATVASTVVTAIATGCIAWFTISLAKTSREQGQLTAASLKLATDEFQATRRPRIIVRSFQTLMEPGGEPSITFLYVNTGDLPAKITEIRVYVGVGNPMLADPVFERHLIKGVVLESGDKEIMEVEPPANFHFQLGYSGEVGYQGDVRHEADAYLIGCVMYEDSRGRQRETGFCRVSKGSNQPWVTVKDSEYEYQD